MPTYTHNLHIFLFPPLYKALQHTTIFFRWLGVSHFVQYSAGLLCLYAFTQHDTKWQFTHDTVWLFNRRITAAATLYELQLLCTERRSLPILRPHELKRGYVCEGTTNELTLHLSSPDLLIYRILSESFEVWLGSFSYEICTPTKVYNLSGLRKNMNPILV
jgi:hypothetical protein